MGDLNTRAGKALAGRWRAGMLAIDNGRVRHVGGGRIEWDYLDDSGSGHFRQRVGDVPAHVVPDMSDPATRGAFLDVVREAWGAPFAQASPRLRMVPVVTCNGWRVYLNDADERSFEGPTEAEALVAALEAAPVRA